MSKIEWTDQTLNFVSGCTKVSAGCQNCYAEKMHRRLHGMYNKKLTDFHEGTTCENCEHEERYTDDYEYGTYNVHCSEKQEDISDDMNFDCSKFKHKQAYSEPFNKIVCNLSRLEEGLKKLDKVDYWALVDYKNYEMVLPPRIKFSTKQQADVYSKQNIYRAGNEGDGREIVPIKKSYRIFVNSMSDTFHEDIPFSDIKKAFSMMEKYPQHTFQILTKRHIRLVNYIENHDIPKNLHLGFSICDNRDLSNFEEACSTYDARFKKKDTQQYRIQHKFDINRTDYENSIYYINKNMQPLPKMFISFEPLLEKLDNNLLKKVLPHINWSIVGGESGNKARPMNIQWVYEIRDLCITYDIPFFFKQWSQARNYLVSPIYTEKTKYTAKISDSKIFYNLKDAEEYLKTKENHKLRIVRNYDYKTAILDGKKYQEYPKDNDNE